MNVENPAHLSYTATRTDKAQQPRVINPSLCIVVQTEAAVAEVPTTVSAPIPLHPARSASAIGPESHIPSLLRRLEVCPAACLRTKWWSFHDIYIPSKRFPCFNQHASGQFTLIEMGATCKHLPLAENDSDPLAQLPANIAEGNGRARSPGPPPMITTTLPSLRGPILLFRQAVILHSLASMLK